MTYPIIFYYPEKKYAPAHVARSIFMELMKSDLSNDIFPFIQRNTLISELLEHPGKCTIFSLADVLFSKQKLIVHFSLNPTVFPNRKFILFLICLLRGHRMIINYHGDPREEFIIKFKSLNPLFIFYIFEYIFSPLIMKQANFLIVNSFIMEKQFKLKYGLTNIVVIPNGINEFWFKRPETSKWKTNLPNNGIDFNTNKCTNIFKYVYHGRLAPEKGVENLLRGFSFFIKNEALLGNQCFYQLTIIGNGPERSSLEKLSLELEINNNVTFLGHISDFELRDHLLQANAAIYPSIYEPFSLAVLEAFATVEGPVLCSKNVGINDFVTMEGYTFVTFEPTEENIARVLKTASVDTCAGKSFLEQKQFAEKYTWNNIYKEYVNLYYKLRSI